VGIWINHTNVELKSYTTSALIYLYARLIIPMWNWNEEVVKDKLFLWRWINHTNVELKFVQYADGEELITVINHTNVELKFNKQLGFAWIVPWLIIPMWNWNWLCQWLVLSYFSINHTNVELKLPKFDDGIYSNYSN